MKPSIAYVASSTYVFQNFFMETLREIKARGFDVLLFSPADGPLGQFEHEGFEHIRIPMSRSTNPVSAAVTWLLLHSAFIERRPVIVHSHTTTVHLLSAMAARSAGVPISVATVHGHYDTGMDQLVGRARAGLLAPMTERYAKAVARRVDAYIVINQTEADRFESVVPPEKLHLVEGGVGVDLSLFGGSSGKREARRRLRLPESQRQVGFVGRLIDHKARDLFEIIDRIQREAPGTGALLALLPGGDPDLEERLGRRIAQGRDIVVLRNRAPREMAMVYRCMDALLLPSYREGASTVLMEAAAMRIPTVAYDVAGTRDIVDDGRTGLLVSVGDRAAFARAAGALLESSTRRRNMGIAARARAVSAFDREKTLEHTLSLYDRLIDTIVRVKDT